MPDPVFTGINHLGIATRDLGRVVRTWSDTYGVGPSSLCTYDPSNMSAEVDGLTIEFAMRVALCRMSPTFRVEILQPLDERSPYARSLVAHGDADHIHHVRLEVADYSDARERLEGLGLARPLDAVFTGLAVGPRVQATYFDTEHDLGFVVEIGEVPAGFAMPRPESTYPEADASTA